jgi:hypothetical protein
MAAAEATAICAEVADPAARDEAIEGGRRSLMLDDHVEVDWT